MSLRSGEISHKCQPDTFSRINIQKLKMKTLTLKIRDDVNDKFTWLLDHFAPSEVRILEQSEFIDDDAYLRGVPGMVASIQQARLESESEGVTVEKLEW